MKWILTLVYILSALVVSGCASQAYNDRQVVAAPLEVIIEHPLITEVRTLSGKLLQQPYFVQGSFKHGQLLYITLPNTTVTLPVTHNELQRASAETCSKPDWFDIQILTEQVSQYHSDRTYSGYSLVIYISQAENTSDKYKLSIELINNRFNTVEAQVSSTVFL